MNTSLMLVLAFGVGAPALKDKKEPLGEGPGYLGITFSSSEGGLMISQVLENTPAAKAGLKPGDVMTKVNETSLDKAETADFIKIVANMRPNQIVALDIQRGDEKLTVKVKLGPRPKDFDMLTRPVPPPIIIDDPE